MSTKLSVVAPALVCAAVFLSAPASQSPGEPARGATKDPFDAAAASTAQPKDKRAAEKPPTVGTCDRSTAGKALSAEERIERALDQPTTLDFSDTPLSEVIAYLKDHHKIEIELDRKAMDDVGVGSDMPVTRSLTGISLRSALDLLLRDLELTYTIRDEVLLITTPDAAAEQLLTRVYDVADLVTVHDEAGRRCEDYDSLVHTVTCAVAPQSWNEVGGPASITVGTFGSAKVLIVSQTYQAHREIAKLLADVRKIAAKNPSDEPPLRHRPEPPCETSGTGVMGGMGGMMGGRIGPDGEGDRPMPKAKAEKPGKPNRHDRDDDGDSGNEHH